MSLDATVLLVTPVVLATARALSVPARPHAYATAHLANSATSLLLPVFNLTNLLAFTAAGLSFGHVAVLMSLAWLAAIVVEYVLLRRLFTRELAEPPTTEVEPEASAVPVFALSMLALTLVGFVVVCMLGFSPAWGTPAGVLVLGTATLVVSVLGLWSASGSPACSAGYGDANAGRTADVDSSSTGTAACTPPSRRPHWCRG